MTFLAIIGLTFTIISGTYSAGIDFLSNRQQSPSVIIVGAGVAGLRAATLLHDAGYNVTVLEAQNRIGGRTYTVRLGNSTSYLEEGAEWIHGQKGNIVHELASSLGLVWPTEESHKKSTIHRSRRNTPVLVPLEYGNYYGLQTGEVLNSSVASKLEMFRNYVWEDDGDWLSDYDGVLSLGHWAKYVLNKFNQEIGFGNNDTVFLEAVYDWAQRSSTAEDPADSWFDISWRDEGEQYVLPEGHAAVRWKPPYSYASLLQLILTGKVTEDGLLPLPDYIKLSTEVTNIRYSTDQGNVTIRTRDGTEYTADHVIFTPSLGVLKATHETLFTPNLSPLKRRSIQNIGFGTVSKIGLEFSQPWWPENFEGMFTLWMDHNHTNSSLEYWRTNITDGELLAEDENEIPLWARSILSFFNVDSMSAPNVLRVWVSGRPSRLLDGLEDNDYIQNKIMRVLHKYLDPMFPNITDPVGFYKSSWYSNPFTRGSYSFRTLDSDTADVWARNLSIPIVQSVNRKPLICFAGEATHPIYYSTVHGAYETGIMEAERIIDYYRLSSDGSSSYLLSPNFIPIIFNALLVFIFG